MKLYISADLEGVGGVTSPHQVHPENTLDKHAYEQAVFQLVQELNTICETAFDSGVKSIVINDAHARMDNLWHADLLNDRRLSLISGKPKMPAMMAGLDGSFTACFFVGYHAKAGTPEAVLTHTFHPDIFDLQINGQPLGEGAINAFYAWKAHHVPLLMASGDRAFCKEMKQVCPSVQTVETKIGHSFSAAECHNQQEILASYQTIVKALLSADPSSWKPRLAVLKQPYQVKMTLTQPRLAELVAQIPGWQVLDGRTVISEHEHYPDVMKQIQASYSILAYEKTL